MRYNLTGFNRVFTKHIPSYELWRENLHNFFYNDDYDPAIRDEYYDILLENFQSLQELLQYGYLTDEHSGLFTFDKPEMKSLHTFNLSNLVRRNHQYFYKKKIRTICADFGILNIQVQLCGLDLVGTLIPPDAFAGSILAVIGNKCHPYSFKDNIDADVVFAAHIFSVEQTAFSNWNVLTEYKAEGKEIYFTTSTFSELKKFVSYDRIQQVENPSEVYHKDAYSNLDLGLSNKIYKLV